MTRDYRFTFQLFPDARTSAEISKLIERLRVSGLINEAFVPISYQPHLTLSAFAQLDKGFALATAADLAARYPEIPVAFTRTGQFTGSTNALYFSPSPSPALSEIHRDLHRKYKSRHEEPWHLYTPSEWVPHIGVVIDTDPTPVATAAKILGSHCLPAGQLTRIGVTGFGPAVEFPLLPASV